MQYYRAVHLAVEPVHFRHQGQVSGGGCTSLGRRCGGLVSLPAHNTLNWDVCSLCQCVVVFLQSLSHCRNDLICWNVAEQFHHIEAYHLCVWCWAHVLYQ